MTRKKIAIIAPGLLPIPAIKSGGIEQLIENIIKQNEKTPTVQITVISAYSPLTKTLEKGYIHTSFRNIKYSILGRCLNFIDNHILSKIFGHQYYHNGIRQIMRIIKKEEFDKVVIYGNDHHIKPISTVVSKEKIVFILATLMLNKKDDFSLCKKILVGSNHSKESVLNHAKKLCENDLRVIQSGIDTDYFSNLIQPSYRDEIRQKLQINEDVPLICYLGRIVESKGVVVLLQSLISIQDHISFKLILIGSFGSNFGEKNKSIITDEEIEIKRLISILGEKCIVTGFIDEQDLPGYLSAVDIGIVPSICEDVSPLTYFQFQAMGKPTIVSDGGGIPEFYSPDYSIMVKRGPDMINELAEAICKLIENKSLQKRMAGFAVKNREYLGIERLYNDFMEAVLED